MDHIWKYDWLFTTLSDIELHYLGVWFLTYSRQSILVNQQALT